MAVNLSPIWGAGAQLLDNSGNVLSGGKIYTYAAGTTTPTVTYTSSNGLIANSNPIILNSAGRVPYEIWLTDGVSYKFVLKDSNDTLIATYDDITGMTPSGTVDNLIANLANTTDVTKGDALIGFKQSDTSGILAGAVGRTVHQKLQEIVSPKDFGAVGDGVTDDKAAVKAALESGYIVDGGGLTYAINGSCTPTSIVGLQNANFVQIGDNTATNFNTLDIVGLSDFFIDNVKINMGSNITTLYSDDGNNGLRVWGTQSGSGTGTTTTYVTNFKITRVNVTGNGCGTGIQIRHAKRFNVDNCLVHDRVSGSSPDPTNDSQNGIEIVNSADFVMSNCEVYNLQTRLSGVGSTKWTRGFLFAEVRDCNIVGCNATSTDQNYDFSGGVSDTSPSTYRGNRNFTLSGCASNNAGTWGFKFANVTHDGLITGCIANNAGGGGFVVSTQSTSIVLSNDSYRTQNLDFVGCKVVNVTGTSWAGMTPVGFKIDGDGTGAHSYPRNIRFIGCDVVDNQSSPTTVSGFDSGVVLPENATTGWNAAIANVVENCSSLNCTTFIGSTNRIGPPVCVVTSNTTQSLTTATWTQLNWNLDLSDPNYMHSVTNNTNWIVIRTPGWYRLTAQISFAANGTGSRQIRFTNSGTTIDRTTVEMNPDAGIDCYAQSTYIGYFETGRYVAVEGYQDSGGGLNANLNESNFSVEKIG